MKKIKTPSNFTAFNIAVAYKNKCKYDIQTLQTTLDNMSVNQWDLEDKCKSLALKVCELESKLEGANGNSEREKRERIDAEDRYQKVIRALETSENNRNHAVKEMLERQKTIDMSKKEMEVLRASKVSDEHMARKLLELIEENRHLTDELSRTKSQITEIKADYESREVRAYEAPPHEIQEYQKQTTRLINEKVQIERHLDHTEENLRNMTSEKNALQERVDRMTKGNYNLILALQSIYGCNSWFASKGKQIALDTLIQFGTEPKK